MRTHLFSKFFLLFLSTLLLNGLNPVFGQDEGAAEEETVQEEPGLTQGQAASIIARRLGLFSSSGDQTQAAAIQQLSARGISPKGGWSVDEEFEIGDLARILVQALGLEGELSEAEIAGDDPQPYIDLLIENYGVDVNELVSPSTVARMGSGRPGSGNADGNTSSDPLLLNDIPLGETEQEETPVSQAELENALSAVVGGSSGSGGSNITPSAP